MIYYSGICLNDVTLRDYQQTAKEHIFSNWDYVDNILYQMPTGTGKTRLYTSIIRDINIWGLQHGQRLKILIIAHRSELIEQSSRSLNKYHIKHGVWAGTMKEKRNLSLPIQVASIQTIMHSANQTLVQDLDFDFIIIDEAHHAVANSYTKLWDFCPNSKKLGVTATPWRMNNGGFKHIFDIFIPSMSIKEYIDKGWLASYQYYSIPHKSEIQQRINSITEFDLEGDYKTSALVSAMDNNQIRSLLYDSYDKLAKGKKGIIYSISRVHSEHICRQYRRHGVAIENIDSETPAKTRENIIKRFKEGKLDIIVNVDIFSEGFDCPDIEFIQLARPTKSLVKYLQKVGRGLRKNGDKRCIILDNVGMYYRFGLPDIDRDWTNHFIGDESHSSTNKTTIADISTINKHERLVDMTEGNESMVLIQDLFSIYNEDLKDVEIVDVVHSTTEHVLEKTTTEPVNQSGKKFCITSNTFFSKYQIEESEEGFYAVNTRYKQRRFLIQHETYPGGSITVKKCGPQTYEIIKSSTYSKPVIIGYMKKTGFIIRFSSFDKSVLDLNISI